MALWSATYTRTYFFGLASLCLLLFFHSFLFLLLQSLFLLQFFFSSCSSLFLVRLRRFFSSSSSCLFLVRLGRFSFQSTSSEPTCLPTDQSCLFHPLSQVLFTNWFKLSFLSYFQISLTVQMRVWQLNRWPCHWVSHSLTRVTFWF